MVTARRLYQSICGELLHPEFLENTQIKGPFIKEIIEAPEFINQISYIVTNRDYSCGAVLHLCKQFLHKLWGDEMPPDPLFYIYQFTLSKSFPQSVEIDLRQEWTKGCLLYLQVLRVVAQLEMESDGDTILQQKPLRFLTNEEESYYKVSEEYRHFKWAFYQEYIYEMMKLNQEVLNHNTLDHISGVHHLALFIGKQLFDAGVPVDLGRVSGAAAGHDLGKFGCKSWEGKRVAYLHYYYTDLWFKNHGITFIGHIALNHSVWDLELENLSIESLILIYSDFRVKNDFNEKANKYEMTFFSLKDSFQVILDKLDNLDATKERRYTRVYSKLKDFEDYLLNLNIETNPDLPATISPKLEKKYFSLMKGKEVTENLKYLAIRHNILLMYHFRNESSLNEILEMARSEEDPRNLRAYLDVFHEYCTYLTQKQKIITLRFLYEKLVHSEEDIRRHSAEVMGNLIILFDEDYRKEIPQGVTLAPAAFTSCSLLEEYIDLFINPPHQIIPLHRQWMGYSMKVLITYIFSMCTNRQIQQYKNVVLKYYSSKTFYETNINIYLLDIIKYIPLEDDTESLTIICDYLSNSLRSNNQDLKVASLDAIDYLVRHLKDHRELIKRIEDILLQYKDVGFPAENYLQLRISKSLSMDEEISQHYHQLCQKDMESISDLFLSNLKTATSWVTKKVQVKMLLEYFLENGNVTGLYTAMHFCNLLKVSAVESVRNGAGRALVKLFPHLPVEQRNDIAIELLRGLEIEGYQFTKYIPIYLGKVLLYLRPYELDEVIDDLEEKIRQSNNQTKSLLLRTIGIIISGYDEYAERFQEDENAFAKRQTKLLGILINGLVHDDLQIRQISFTVIGKELFGSKILTKAEKYFIFKTISKKLLTLLAEGEESQLLFLSNAAGLNYIYRFITDYVFEHGEIQLPIPSNVAFFPGTFDPFTLGHKEISKAIRDEGFEVFLAVDEFSWSKRTQPNLIRRNIINKSIADEMNIFLYPEDFPTNIGNPKDLKQLKEIFNNEDVYIVVGSDVVMNASAYHSTSQENTIHHFPHIIFERRENGHEYDPDKLQESLKQILAPVVNLTLPPRYEDISSTQIRNYIDEGRDISKLMDPLAQKYIYKNNLYKKEPQYKSVIQTISIDVEVIEDYQEDLIYMVASSFHQEVEEVANRLKKLCQDFNGRMVIIKDINNANNLLAYSIFHWIPSDRIYQEFQDSKITELIRSKSTGRIISLDGFFIKEYAHLRNLYQIILTETLTYCLRKDFSYGIYRNNIDDIVSEELMELIRLHGFLPVPTVHEDHPIMAVDLTNPCTLNLDLETVIKEPFRSNGMVKEVIGSTRKNLQEALTKLYPGNLVLSFDRSIIDETLVRKICRENGVPPLPTQPRKLGDLMCVPFGNILNRAIVPNTVTKSLHTEKLFYPYMKGFTIGSYPFYLDLINQVKMIRSFNRPVILVDDLLNKGYRIKALDPLFKTQGVNVQKTIVGILSGRGKELMEIQNREVECAYFMPKLNLWFNENLMYPFIGGDTLWRGVYPEENLLPSINLILPYTSPYYIRGVSNHLIHNLSEVSIRNSIEILRVLEIEYQKVNERKLTLASLNEVFLYPRCPDHGENIYYDLSLSPSHYLKNDLELLNRLESSIITSETRRD
ncbi:nucleotidyl transferase family protein [Alkaliphilus hydrothermalis]|uniref:nicotinate-nucleotide adenylyltransferase n=1 Tax=Alkaliphilus hydrothermalis TaxID=1482730 RepID=A0ABS2NN26_9FIRM|nr:cytidyltransferase [Alkaliphilus hydrothermalis]MBM7614307.1 nicotinic acid mononucleotide adenylyltransferase/hypoxanthine-guanine phosphoribosyltransferase [Alkaliphilus hydrothermalis]